MSRKETITFYDDLDGKPIDPEEITVKQFSVGNKTYQLDLRPTNVEKFEKDMGKWIEHATKVPQGSSTRSTRQANRGTPKEELVKIREWARSNDYTVSDKGRVPAYIMEAYYAANE